MNSGKLEFRLANMMFSYSLTEDGEMRGFYRMLAPDDKTVLAIFRATLKRQG